MAEIPNYPSNSFKSKREAAEANNDIQKVEDKPVNNGQIKIKEESAFKKIMRTFFVEDFKDIKEAIIYDYIIPGIKDAIRSSIDMMLGGDGRRRSSSTNSRNSYDKYYDKRSSEREREDRRRRDYSDDRRRLSYDDFIYLSRRKAEEVREDLINIMDKYESVSLDNFYDVLRDNGMDVSDSDRQYTDCNKGWYDLGPMSIEPVRGGYIINLPRPVSLD